MSDHLSGRVNQPSDEPVREQGPNVEQALKDFGVEVKNTELSYCTGPGPKDFSVITSTVKNPTKIKVITNGAQVVVTYSAETESHRIVLVRNVGSKYLDKQ